MESQDEELILITSYKYIIIRKPEEGEVTDGRWQDDKQAALDDVGYIM